MLSGTRVRGDRVDVHGHVVLERWEPLLEVAGCVAVVGDDVEAGFFISGIKRAWVDSRRVLPELMIQWISGSGAVLGPHAVGVLRPAGVGEDLSVGIVWLVRVGRRPDRTTCRERSGRSAAAAGPGRTARRSGCRQVAVDRLGERVTEVGVLEGARTALVRRAVGVLLEVQALVVAPCLSGVVDVRIGQRLVMPAYACGKMKSTVPDFSNVGPSSAGTMTIAVGLGNLRTLVGVVLLEDDLLLASTRSSCRRRCRTEGIRCRREVVGHVVAVGMHRVLEQWRRTDVLSRPRRAGQKLTTTSLSVGAGGDRGDLVVARRAKATRECSRWRPRCTRSLAR